MMATDDTTRRERIEHVSNIDSDDDNLVTLAVPPERDLGTVQEEIEEEHAEAEYLDGATSKPVQQALEDVRRVLQDYDATPDDGLVVYADGREGETTVFDDPSTPVEEFVYVRSNEFDTEPLTTVGSPSPVYGLVVVEQGEAAFGRFTDGEVRSVETLDNEGARNTRATSDSDERFERDRNQLKTEFFEAVADRAERAFLEGGGEESDGSDAAESAGDAPEPTVDALAVGGSSVTVEQFLDGDYLDHRLRDRTVEGDFAVEDASEEGLRQLAEKAEEELTAAEREELEAALDRFFAGLEADDPEESEVSAVTYGLEAVDEALEYDAVETALVSTELDDETASEIERRASEAGGKCLVVPTTVERGEEFAGEFGGVGAVLRFPIE